MRRLLPILLTFAGAANGARAQEPPVTPAERYETLRKEADKAASSPTALTDDERRAFVGRAYARRHAFAREFLALAKAHPADPIALDALMQAAWQVNTTPWPVGLVGEDTASAEALDLVRLRHMDSDRLAPLCARVAHGFRQEYETLLRAVAADSPHQVVRAAATLALGQYLHERVHRVDLCRAEPELAAEFADLFGRSYLTELLRQDRFDAMRAIEAVFEHAVADYGDVKLASGQTVAARAAADLFEIRHLSVGREAPDIEGEDQHGERLRLSDYRGKVVLLGFWSYV